MRGLIALSGIGLLSLAAGCHHHHDAGPDERAAMEPADGYVVSEKPLPPPNAQDSLPTPLYSDPPLISQHVPEEEAFLSAYDAVGRPRLLVFVNRTLDGELIPVNGTPVTISRSDNSYSYNGSSAFHERRRAFLPPGQYDEAQARNIDYQAIENVLSDWISAGGHVQLASPTLARQRLSDDQVRDLQHGRPVVGRELAQELDAQVLIQVQARPTRQTSDGLEVRMIAEAIDLKHNGVSLGRAVVDVPPPLDRGQIDGSTRFLARKLMDGMTMSWQGARRAGPAVWNGPSIPSPNSPTSAPPLPDAEAAPTAAKGDASKGDASKGDAEPPVWPHPAPSAQPAVTVSDAPSATPASPSNPAVTVPTPPTAQTGAVKVDGSAPDAPPVWPAPSTLPSTASSAVPLPPLPDSPNTSAKSDSDHK